MTTTGVKLVSVAELLDKKYFIRSYQRGYRWDENQVHDLLNDFKEFIEIKDKNEDEFYSLQPIVVKVISEFEKNNLERFNFKGDTIYEVIDGQQRITTITILLHFLISRLNPDVIFKKNLPEITYEVRPRSKEILSNFNKYIIDNNDTSEIENDIDFFHMKMVYDAISKWFENKSDFYLPFLKLLTAYKINNVRVIWYEVEDKENSIDVFRRFNIGKIPLTNAELIKALFLKNDNANNTSLVYSISKEWQSIENQMQNPFLWSFLNPKKEYTSRIEYLFDLIFEKEKRSSLNKEEFNKKFGTDNANVFRFYLNEVKHKSENLQNLWDDVVKAFESINQWYTHPEHYHYIGYLQNREGIKSKENIILEVFTYLDKETKQPFQSKEELTNFLLSKIKSATEKYFENEVIKLNYESDKSSLRNLFFLFNVELCTKLATSGNGEEVYRLPFHLHKNTNYDIEHIDSKIDKEVKDLNEVEKIEYLKDLQTDFEVELNEKFDALKDEIFIDSKSLDKWSDENIRKGNLEKVLNELLDHLDNVLALDNEHLIINKNQIGNITALNDSINRSYGNSFYTTKRRRIIEEELKGTYIPLATKNVFLKYFSRNVKKHSRWFVSDALDYKSVMESSLKKFMK